MSLSKGKRSRTCSGHQVWSNLACSLLVFSDLVSHRIRDTSGYQGWLFWGSVQVDAGYLGITVVLFWSWQPWELPSCSSCGAVSCYSSAGKSMQLYLGRGSWRTQRAGVSACRLSAVGKSSSYCLLWRWIFPSEAELQILILPCFYPSFLFTLLSKCDSR